MSLADVVGLIAGFILLAGYVPQIIKAYKTKSLGDISLVWLSFLVVASMLWISYGYLKNDSVLILVNAVGLTEVSILFAMKLLYKRR